jgi:hypothetical protein
VTGAVSHMGLHGKRGTGKSVPAPPRHKPDASSICWPSPPGYRRSPTSRPGRRRGRELVAAAKDAGVPLNGFHNRRWDIRAVAALLETTRPTGQPTTDPSPGAVRCEAEPDLALDLAPSL